MKNFCINLLFKLLGNTCDAEFPIKSLFGVASDVSHASRKKRWEKALARAWRDKDLMDFLYYQQEADKENAWKRKVDPLRAQGARVRTLFIVHSAKRASLEMLSKKRTDGEARGEHTNEVNKDKSVYNAVVDIS